MSDETNRPLPYNRYKLTNCVDRFDKRIDVESSLSQTGSLNMPCTNQILDSSTTEKGNVYENIWQERDSVSEESMNNIKKKKDIKEAAADSVNKTKPNKYKERKNLKDKGLEYKTISGKIRPARKVQVNPCGKGKCSRNCGIVSEVRRQSIFNNFWSLDNNRKRDWLVDCVTPSKIKRKKTTSAVSRRSLSYEYFINEGEERMQVCQQFILRTLDISQKFLLYTIRNAREGKAQEDRRKRTAPNKYDEETVKFARTYIENLPFMRLCDIENNSTRMLLPQEFKNASNLYRLYLKYCKDQSKASLSARLFSNLFREEYKIGFYIPKKYKCVSARGDLKKK